MKGAQPVDVSGTAIAGCPDKPNCVSTEAESKKHRIEPFRVKGDLPKSWPQIQKVVEGQSRTTIIAKTDVYLHAEIRSLLFRFVDDLELLLNPDSGIVAVRSAARTGHSDFGVNRRRVEGLRETLFEAGLIY